MKNEQINCFVENEFKLIRNTASEVSLLSDEDMANVKHIAEIHRSLSAALCIGPTKHAMRDECWEKWSAFVDVIQQPAVHLPHNGRVPFSNCLKSIKAELDAMRAFAVFCVQSILDTDEDIDEYQGSRILQLVDCHMRFSIEIGVAVERIFPETDLSSEVEVDAVYRIFGSSRNVYQCWNMIAAAFEYRDTQDESLKTWCENLMNQ